MATTKITDLTAYTDPISTDVVPIVDVTSDVTKKVSIADLMENAGSGTEALPGISFDGDPDTGIYRPDANQLAVATNGAGRLFVDSSGQVGIGTSSPSTNLELASGPPSFKLTRNTTASTGNDFARILFENSAGTTLGSIRGYSEDGNTDLGLKLSTGTDDTVALTIDESQRVGIGTTPVDKKLTILGTDTTNSVLSSVSVHLINDNAGAAGRTTSLLFGGRNENADPFAGIAGIMTGDSAFEQSGHLAFYTKTSPAAGAPDERARIDSSGRLLVGTTSSASFSTAPQLVLQGTSVSDAGIFLARNVNASSVVAGNLLGNLVAGSQDGGIGAWIRAEGDGTWSSTSDCPGRLVFSTTADGASSPTQRMTISANGTVTINEDTTVGSVASSGSGNGVTLRELGLIHVSRSNAANPVYQGFTTGTSTPTFEVIANGDASFDGAVSKGSGSFKISHPLPEKTDTHYLYHSFIEGPQADLIYRGHVQLVNGTASVNIDEAARMTEGTFEALCTNVCCFTSNESDWTAVRGSVSGNILTIEAQDPASTADICWMVVGERKDQHMLDTGWTDANGRVITERLKSEVDSPVEE